MMHNNSNSSWSLSSFLYCTVRERTLYYYCAYIAQEKATVGNSNKLLKSICIVTLVDICTLEGFW